MKSVLLLLVVFALTGCKPPITPEQSEAAGKGFQVDRLFTHEGCTVFRFEDSGRYRYFSKCDGPRSETSWVEGCGKNCTREVSIPTVRGAL